MSIEQKKEIFDVIKVILYMVMGVCGFLMVDVYRTQSSKIDTILNKIEQVESRVIRMEYELKLK
jgi:K+-transporting ATPase A subunit